MQIKKDGKTNIWAAGFVALLLLVSVGIVAAHGFGKEASNDDVQDSSETDEGAEMSDMGCMGGKGMQGMMNGGMCEHHEQMEEIVEEGSFEDLIKFREETGMNIMPWVQNEQDFAKAKEMHEEMEEMHEKMMAMHKNGGQGMSGMMGKGTGHEGCPMMG